MAWHQQRHGAGYDGHGDFKDNRLYDKEAAGSTDTLLPAVAVVGLSIAFSWLAAGKIKRCRPIGLIAE